MLTNIFYDIVTAHVGKPGRVRPKVSTFENMDVSKKGPPIKSKQARLGTGSNLFLQCSLICR